MSKQIDRLMKKHPYKFKSVEYDGNGLDGGGTWLYLQPSWYEYLNGTSCIHEYTIKAVLENVKYVYQDKKSYLEENQDLTMKELGAYDD